MSVHAASLDHRLWVLFAVLTHAAIGFTLVAVFTEGNPSVGALGAILPDVDLLFAPEWSFPLVHRGLTHTPVFVAAVVGLLLVSGRGRWAGAVTLGLGSHLLVDTFTKSGVAWFYPVSNEHVAVDLSVHAPEHGALIWLVLLAVLLFDRRRATTVRGSDGPAGNGSSDNGETAGVNTDR